MGTAWAGEYGVRWRNRAHHGSVAAGLDKPGFEHNRKITMAAREQPGEWVDLMIHATAKQARQKVWNTLNRPSICFRPIEAFEVQHEQRPDGWAVKIRYIGLARPPEAPS